MPRRNTASSWLCTWRYATSTTSWWGPHVPQAAHICPGKGFRPLVRTTAVAVGVHFGVHHLHLLHLGEGEPGGRRVVPPHRRRPFSRWRPALTILPWRRLSSWTVRCPPTTFPLSNPSAREWMSPGAALSYRNKGQGFRCNLLLQTRLVRRTTANKIPPRLHFGIIVALP